MWRRGIGLRGLCLRVLPMCSTEILDDGDLVGTTVARTWHPLVRSPRGDRGAWTTERCPYGQTALRFRLLGRWDDCVRGHLGKMHLEQVFNAFRGFPARSAEFQIPVELLEGDDPAGPGWLLRWKPISAPKRGRVGNRGCGRRGGITSGRPGILGTVGSKMWWWPCPLGGAIPKDICICWIEDRRDEV